MSCVDMRARRPGRRVSTVHPACSLVACLLVGAAGNALAQAVQSPVNYGANAIAGATFLEDHGGWHAGVDFPGSGAPPTNVQNPQTGTLAFLFTHTGVANPHTVVQAAPAVVAGENSTIQGAWQLKVKDPRTKFLLDVITVQRLRSGQPPTNYTVANVNETPANSGFSDGVVNLVVNSPNAGAALVAGDTLAVTYAFYQGEVRGIYSETTGAPTSYSHCNHIDNVQKFVAWNTYPATAANRFYDKFNVPAGRVAHPLTAGVNVAEIGQFTAAGYGYASEPDHVHYSMLVGGLAFPNSCVNPLNGHLPFNDPNNVRPTVRSFGLVPDSSLAAPPIVPTLYNGRQLYGDIHIFLEAVDNMGATEVGPDRDTNNTRETGVYNAGYYLAPMDRGVAPLGTRANPLWFAAPPPAGTVGVDSTRGTGVNAVALLAPNPPANSGLFKIDVNTNYHVWVSHVGMSATRLWRTNASALDPAGNADGSGKGRALLNQNALFPDGIYKLGGVARDVAGLATPRDSLVTVDNYRPYVRSVIIKQNGLTLYQADWNETPGNKLDLSPPLLKDRQLRYAVANVPILFKVIVSESVAMDTTVAFLGSTPMVRGGKTYQVRFDPATALRYDPQGDGAIKGADLTAIQIDSLTTTYRGLDTVWGSAIISDAAQLGLPTFDGDAVLVLDLEDLSFTGTGAASGGSGNRLLAMDFTDYVPATHQIDVATKLTRAANGSLQGTAGLDKVHRFKIDTQPPTIDITPEVTQ